MLTVYIDSFMIRCVSWFSAFAGLKTSLVAVLPTARVTRRRCVSVRCDQSRAVYCTLNQSSDRLADTIRRSRRQPAEA